MIWFVAGFAVTMAIEVMLDNDWFAYFLRVI